MPAVFGTGIPLEPTARETGRQLRQLADGKLNVVGEVTLASGSTSTVLRNRRFGAATEIVLVPRSAAQAALAVWLAAKAQGELTLGHDAPVGDQTLGYIALG